MKRLLLALAFVLAFATQGYAQVLFDNSVTASNSAQTSITTGTFTISASADRYLLVIVIDDNQGAITGVTGAGQTLASLVTPVINGTRRVHAWGVLNPTSGSQSVTVQGSGAWADCSQQHVIAMTFTGVNGTTPVADITTATGTGTATSVTVTNTTADSYVADGVAHGDLSAQGADQTSLITNAYAGASIQDGVSGGAMTWTAVSESLAWAALGVRITPAGGGPTRAPSLLLLGVGGW